MKVLHLPTSTGGNSWGLAQGEKQLGLDSKVLIDSQNWLNYPYDFCMNINNYGKIGGLYKRVKTFLDVYKGYDIYHFNFGSSLVDIQSKGIHLWDLPYYKGKKIMTYNGCDARQKYPTIDRVDFSACHDKKCYRGACYSGKLDLLRSKRINKVSKYVDHIFSLNPDLFNFLPKKATFLPYTIAGWDSIFPTKYEINDKIKIVHSPTNREAKGSSFILKALKTLQQKYANIDVEIIENVPYELALKKYREAHIVVDQVLIGWYGAFGVEVMKMGKPLAVFIREEDLKYIPKKMKNDVLETVININPFNIEETLEEYIQNISLLYKKSEASLEYTNRWHDPHYVASLTKKVYES